MNAPKANVASVPTPRMAPPKMPLAHSPTLLVTVVLAVSTMFGSMLRSRSVLSIQATALCTSTEIVDHWRITPMVMSAANANAPTTMPTVTMRAPQTRPT
jgi:hypothetical protein